MLSSEIMTFSRMTKEEIQNTIKEFWLLKTNKEIGEMVGLSADAVKKRGQRMKLPPKPLNFRSGDRTTSPDDQLKKFLSVAKTEKEIITKFGSLEVLKQKTEGYTLFTQRNNYNELMYILLPLIDKEVKLLPKRFDYRIGHGEDGTPDPYIICQLPDFKGTVRIALLFDVHYGNFAHRHEKFLSYINWIKENDNVYAVLGGDLMENALDDGRGMTYDQNKNPSTQFDDMVRLLAPISHKILCATTGNHEERTYKKTGIDVMKLLADRLKIPYFSGPIWCTIMANGYKWNLWISHGFSNSKTKGGKMNSANQPKKFTGLIHFLISGHVHDRVCESETMITDDPYNCRLLYMQQWTIIASSFLSWKETYAYKAGYPPPASGGVAVELDDNGEYRGSLT